MTDPNLPPTDRPVERPAEPVHHTTVNVASEPKSGGGGSGIAFIVGGLLVLVAIIAVVMFMRGSPVDTPAETNLDVDIDVPAPQMPDLPDAPKMPDMPEIPAPAPAN